MTIERDNPFVWVTWLSKLMAGDVSCDWAPWFRAHFQSWPKALDDFNLADWQMKHNRMLRELRGKREALGEQILFEYQTKFKYRRPGSRLTLSGQPDLVTVQGQTVRIFDCKTGQQRNADSIQMRIYMHCLPECVAAYRGKSIEGQLVYGDRIMGIPGYSVNAEFVENFNYYLDLIDTDTPPLKMPSYSECSFCDIGKAACPERIEIEAEQAV